MHIYLDATGSKVRGRKARARFSVTWILLAVKVFLCSWMNGKSMRLKHLVVLLAPLWKQAGTFPGVNKGRERRRRASRWELFVLSDQLFCNLKTRSKKSIKEKEKTTIGGE